MSNRRKPSRRGFGPISDPRRAGGDIAGPGGPHDIGGVVLDTRRAVLLSDIDVAHVALGRVKDDEVQTEMAIGMVLAGLISKSDEVSRVLYLFDVDGAANIVSQIISLVERAGPEFTQRLASRLDELGGQGWRSHVPPPPPA